MYSVEKTKELSVFKRFDYILFFAVLLLTAYGLVAVKSATLTMKTGESIFQKQLIGIALGLILCFIICSLDYKDFKTMGVVLYIVSIGLLAAVLVIGTGENLGSKSWLNIKGVSFQPSELAKIAFILLVSVFLERIQEGQDKRKNLIKLCVYAIIPIALVVAQFDIGTTLVFLFIFLVLIYIGGIKLRYLLFMFSSFLLTLPFIWAFVLNDKRRDRIRVFINPELDRQGAGYHVTHAKMTIGSGQLFGKGLFQGIQTQNSLVPVKESDFIFSVIGEELGFIGAVFLILLILFILLRCLYIAKHAREPYGSFLVVGMTGILAAHSIENIGMNIGKLPVTGLPLPFVSAGGTAIVTYFMAVGVVLSVSMRRKKVIFNAPS